METKVDRNSLPKTAEEWDRYLFREYSHGLYPFCYALAKIIWESNSRYLAAPELLPLILKYGRAAKYKQIRHKLRRNRNLLKRMIQNYAKDLKLYGALEEGKIAERDIEYIKRLYPDVEKLEEDIKRDEETLRGKSLWMGKGHPTDTRNKIAAVFAQVIKKENGDYDWVVIHSLILWFWERIKKARYSKELAYVKPVFTPETLKAARAKLIKNPERKLDIERQAERCFSRFIVRSPDMVEIRRPRYWIKFERDYITMDTSEGKESQYPTIVFPDGTVLKGMFNLEEAAAFLDVPPLFLERLCEKELVPYRNSSLYWSSPYQDDDDKERIFSRNELMEWKKEMFGNGAILKRKLGENGEEDGCNKEDIELSKTVATLKKPSY